MTVKNPVKLKPHIKRKFKQKVYEYYWTFDQFAEMILNLVQDCAPDDSNRFMMMTCMHRVFHTNKELFKYYVKWGKAKRTDQQWEYEKQVYNNIPKAIWDDLFMFIDDWMSGVEQPYEDIANDALHEWLGTKTMMDLDDSYCEQCQHRIKCALKAPSNA